MRMSYVLAFDADNTLWDTNAVFRDAQVEMLSTLAAEGLLSSPENCVDELRRLDRKLMSEMGENEYDFRALAEALILYYKDSKSPNRAVESILSRRAEGKSYSELAGKAYERFAETLEKVPSLLPGVEETLSEIDQYRKTGKVITVLFSEGDPDRLSRIMESHDDISEDYFDCVIITSKKNLSSFQDMKKEVRSRTGSLRNPAFIMVGDSISSDVRPANKSGFISIYKPGDFKGIEDPENQEDRPDYTIDSLREVSGVLEQIREE